MEQKGPSSAVDPMLSAIAVLDEFIESAPGNTAEFIVDSESNVVRVVTFQSARQKRLFAAFPEVVLVDSTHDTNVNRYKLFSFAGQYLQHALVQTEEKPNLALSVAVFKRNNPEWANIRVVMTDKALHEKDVLHEAWPNATQLLWHRGADARNSFHNLSQISVPDSVTLSQLSFADQGECPLLEDKQPVPEMDKSDSQEKAAGPAPATSTITSPIVATEGAVAESEATDATDSAPGSASAPIVFASPPKRRGLSLRAEKK
ncbi:hypothetical protein PF004_g7142 [Phytophthora fragariae]|uniref:ZSWIM1/3 RNaseH-like domain-containing protein n=1 Tax=Phytophthora fragariae TaxID=53985 RepID=A0A6G0PAK1_9STRA|nr:hypothetical protein PF004_g7142 [Phytophthora fragariae]